MLAFYSDYYDVKAMRAPRVPVEEQYRLIMECRKSGLSDHQWCLNNDINPGTFYNWVKRLRKNGYGDIPEKNQLSTYEHSHQEVIKIEMNSISVLTEIIYVFLTIFLYLLKCPQSLILSALRAFCLCGKPHISRLIFLYFPCQSWLKSW